MSFTDKLLAIGSEPLSRQTVTVNGPDFGNYVLRHVVDGRPVQQSLRSSLAAGRWNV